MAFEEITTVKIDGSPLVRDVRSMGLSNLDQNSKNEYLTKLKILRTQKEEINNLKQEINSMKNEVSDIKGLLIQLINKK